MIAGITLARRAGSPVWDRDPGAVRVISMGLDRLAAGGSWPAISADGRFVAFFSRAESLVAGDRNGSGDVFVARVCDPQ